MELFSIPEFWVALSALITLGALFAPSPYRQVLLAIDKLIMVMAKVKANKKDEPAELPKAPIDPAQVMREAEAAYRARLNERK